MSTQGSNLSSCEGLKAVESWNISHLKANTINQIRVFGAFKTVVLLCLLDSRPSSPGINTRGNYDLTQSSLSYNGAVRLQ